MDFNLSIANQSAHAEGHFRGNRRGVRVDAYLKRNRLPGNLQPDAFPYRCVIQSPGQDKKANLAEILDKDLLQMAPARGGGGGGGGVLACD